jgi:hypothetical protein
VAKTRPRPKHAGGRPPLFIPAAVLERARELNAGGRDFSTVVRMLAIEGNGSWPRKTLLRRVRATPSSSAPARGQNPPARSRVDVAGGRLEDVAKTDRFYMLEAAAAVATPGTLVYHKAIAAMHASPDNPEGAPTNGPCGCHSCGVAARWRGRRRR